MISSPCIVTREMIQLASGVSLDHFAARIKMHRAKIGLWLEPDYSFRIRVLQGYEREGYL